LTVINSTISEQLHIQSELELRDGNGIAMGAPQFGQRRGFYGTIPITGRTGFDLKFEAQTACHA
jgi:hypothetical protein